MLSLPKAIKSAEKIPSVIVRILVVMKSIVKATVRSLLWAGRLTTKTQKQTEAVTVAETCNHCKVARMPAKELSIRTRRSNLLRLTWSQESDQTSGSLLFSRYAPPPHGNVHSARAGAPAGCRGVCPRSSWRKR